MLLFFSVRFASVSAVKFLSSAVFGLARLCAFSVTDFSSTRLGLDFSCMICSLVNPCVQSLLLGHRNHYLVFGLTGHWIWLAPASGHHFFCSIFLAPRQALCPILVLWFLLLLKRTGSLAKTSSTVGFAARFAEHRLVFCPVLCAAVLPIFHMHDSLFRSAAVDQVRHFAPTHFSLKAVLCSMDSRLVPALAACRIPRLVHRSGRVSHS
jgi:hypothetical protein